ncbi:MAG: seg [Candidatus Taylorbacteria bacterium]|nr:seg [Candidatus Taylorbacteria bacterium]
MKSPFQDIIPSEKRSIRNISLGETKSKERDEDSSTQHVASDVKPKRRKIVKEVPSVDENFVFKGRSKFELSNIVLWGITLVSVIAVFLVLTHFLNSATINIEAKSWSVDLPNKLDLSLSPSAGQVGYSTVTLSDSLSDTLNATGEKDVTTKSTGTIIIYNNFDTNTQKLVAGTRFASSKGLIFKLDKAVSVPGIKKVAGKSAPGSIEATVTADVAGTDYNIALDDFTIPGFKGTAKSDKIYARSKTVMVGGNTGKVATVSDDDLSKKVAELKSQLDLKLKDKASKELPANQVSFDGLSTTDYKIGSPTLQNSKALVQVTATKKMYLIDGNTLAGALLSPQNVNVLPTDEFMFTLGNATGAFASTTNDVSGISFAGKVSLGYKLDIDKFKASIAGASKDQISAIAAKYPAINKVSATIKPFWKSSVPNDVNKITVVVK